MHHRSHALPHWADAGALGVHFRVVRMHRNLAAVTSFAGNLLDLDDALFDLGHLKSEELLDQVRMGSADDHLRPAQFLADRDHVDPQPLAVPVILAGRLLGQRHERFYLTEIDPNGTGVSILLDDTGQDVALGRLEAAELLLVFVLTQPLEDHLAGGGGGDPAEVARGVVVLPGHVALIIQFGNHHCDPARPPIQRDPRAGVGVLGLQVGIEQRFLECLDQVVERDFLVPLDGTQLRKVDFHPVSPPRGRRCRARPQSHRTPRRRPPRRLPGVDSSRPVPPPASPARTGTPRPRRPHQC